MIPHRVRLSGFLSYKDEQTIQFDGSPLWMLSGTNGSGKSSVFDAVTFALFAHHRGGSQSAAELINKESNTLEVEFEFAVDGKPYQVRRTVRRRAKGSPASTQQILARSAADGWEPVAGTQLKTGFDTWVKDHIGLDYETFTSSVLLLQGKSEKLLDSAPSGRASVLAKIVDLERFQKLHGRADDRRKALKGELEGLSNQLAGLRDVADAELAAAAEAIAAAEAGRVEVQQRIDSLVVLEGQARRWAEAQAKLTAAKDKLRQAESVLGHAVAIEKEHARLTELRAVLPAVNVVVTERNRVAGSERKSEELAREQVAAADRKRVADHAAGLAKSKLAGLKKTLAADEVRQTVLTARLRELAVVMEKVKQVEEAEADVLRLDDERAHLPADPDAVVREAQAELDRLAGVSQVLPLLTRLHDDRADLRRTTDDLATTRKDEARLLAEGKAAKVTHDRTTAELTATRDAHGAADRAAAEAKALADQARTSADEFLHLTGEKSCRACGQPLTPAHFAAEKAAREHAANAAAKRAANTASAAKAAQAVVDAATAREAAARASREQLREVYKDTSARVKQLDAERVTLDGSCRQCYVALVDPFKGRFGPDIPDDWAATAYPERNDLSALKADEAKGPAVKRKLKEAQDAAAKAQTVRAKADGARDRLAKLRTAVPAADAAKLRQEQATKQAEDVAVTAAVKAGKQAITQTETEVERHAKAGTAADRELTEIAGALHTEEVSRKQAREAWERAGRTLPADWQKRLDGAGLTDQLKWKEEHDTLAAKGVEASFTRLQAARGGLEPLRAEVVQLTAEADAFPDDCRRSPDEVKGQVATARKALDGRNADLLSAQREKGLLDEYRRQRGDLGDRYKAVELEHVRGKMLAELLGRDRLQRHLVRTAERQIVDCANAVLDRISGGQLFLKLVGTDDGTSAEKALELECANRVSGGGPINVAFLSGSQRFRVAVALALGIGQFAGKGHRPIESVIIDEGFGCLDRAGRQVMIQELQNLRGHLHCILLVSHQEEFAEAFADGYRFELKDGATQVTRVGR